MSAAAYNFKQTIDDNRPKLQPPVCNTMLHNDGPLKIMIVGGPNVRKDYHINQGEEIFYQIEGDMCLKVMEGGVPKDIPIKQGEVFILPACVPHSPQRFENTVGLVIERERGAQSEHDGLRYYADESNKEILWQRYFHCKDLGKELVPLIQSYFASDVYQSRKPTNESVMESPFVDDKSAMLRAPYPLAARYKELHGGGRTVKLESKDFICELVGNGSITPVLPITTECWVWQLVGESNIDGERIKEGSCKLLTQGISEWKIGESFGSPSSPNFGEDEDEDSNNKEAGANSTGSNSASKSSTAPTPTIAMLVYTTAVPDS